MKIRFLLLFLLCLFNASFATVPVNLRCGFWEAPVGMDVKDPVLSWTIQTNPELRGVKQTAYQILVATTPEMLRQDMGDLWNSGKVRSSDMGQ